MTERRYPHFLKQTAVTVSSIGPTFPTLATDEGKVRSLVHRLHPRQVPGGLIRLGPAGDGGYLLPDDLDGIEACFSPGVGDLTGFEEACAARGMRVFMADASVQLPTLAHPSMKFEQKFIGAMTAGDFVTLDDWVRSSIDSTDTDLLLQIDIEGFEYEVLLSLSGPLLRRFRIIAAEFHDLDQLWNGPFFRVASRAFEKLLLTHSCVHIHPNNCVPPIRKSGLATPPVMEFTFLRNDRPLLDAHATQFPHTLDGDNTAQPHYALPEGWYRAR